MVTITLYAKQKKRHRCTEQTLGLCGRRRGWDVSRVLFLDPLLCDVYKCIASEKLSSRYSQQFTLVSITNLSSNFATSTSRPPLPMPCPLRCQQAYSLKLRRICLPLGSLPSPISHFLRHL